MDSELTNLDKIHRLRWNVIGNAFNGIFSVMTFFGSVFVLFLSELQLDKMQIGFLLSLMPFCGVLALLIAPKVAQVGFKRTFLTFWTLRKFAAGSLLLIPVLAGHFSRQGHSDLTFKCVAGVMLSFALCRAIAEIAYIPWQQEIIPNSIRGKFGAVNSIVVTIVSILTMLVASYVIGTYSGLNRFLYIIATGTVAGFLSIWCFSFLPGGRPLREKEAELTGFRSMMNSLTDRNFRLFLVGLGFLTLGTTSLFSFIPLFMKEHVGLSSSRVVLLDLSGSLGVLLSCYLWGWASDRYGSKPIMLSGVCLILLLPLLWFAIPRYAASSTAVALGIAFFAGLSIMGWNTGYGRYLYVTVMPSARRTAYSAVFYAWMGLIGGCGPLLGGRLLDWFQTFKGQFLIFHLDPFTPLFALSFLLLVLGFWTLNRVRSDGAMPVRKFMGMFFQGNPIVALESLARYSWARDEADRVSLAERMGDAKNPLSGNELIEALSDPSFSLRYEAIISISRLPADPKLVDALLLVLVGNEPDLSVAAAWALGKLGDKSAILPLRETLLSEFSLLQAHSARALAKLKDVDSAPYFLEKFRTEPNDKLRLAYASALGTLQVTEATEDLLTFLNQTHDPILRGELAWDIARIIASERYFIQLWRAIRDDPGTPIAQALFDLAGEFAGRKAVDAELVRLARQCANQFARVELLRAASLLSDLLRKAPPSLCNGASEPILRECAERLAQYGPARLEYVLLALQTLNAALHHPE